MAETSLSVIVTHRNVDRFRERNLATVLRHMSRLPGAELVLVEQDARCRLDAGAFEVPVRHQFVYNPGLFNKSWGFNVGARIARSQVLLMLDGDILLEHSAVRAAVDACANGVSAVNPYHELIDLSRRDTEAVWADRRDLARIRGLGSNRSWAGENLCFCGGAYVIDAALYREIGGQDERFEGWGGEDDAMSVTILRLADRTMTLAEARAWHLYHPRRPDDVYRADCYRSNLALANAYYSTGVNELRRLGDQRRERIGDPGKYSGCKPKK